MFQRFGLSCMLLLQQITCMAADNPLDIFLLDFSSWQASFSQTLFDENQIKLEQSEGHVYLRNSGAFHWGYQKPYVQKIISDGALLWFYDADIKQVILRKVDDTINQTPIGIFLKPETLDLYFRQEPMGKIEGFDWIKLISNHEDTVYREIRIGFDHHQLAMMIVTDYLGQIARFDFSESAKNADPPDYLFQFTLPEGVELIDER